MPNPKRRHSKARRDKRRAHDALAHAPRVDLPELRRGQAAAPRLRPLRLLPRPAGGRRSRTPKSLIRVARSPCRARLIRCASPSTPWGETTRRAPRSRARCGGRPRTAPRSSWSATAPRLERGARRGSATARRPDRDRPRRGGGRAWTSRRSRRSARSGARRSASAPSWCARGAPRPWSPPATPARR